MTTILESLKKYSSVVADTGDIDSIQKFNPDDCTTNPSLIFKAVQSEKYNNLVTDVYVKDFSKEKLKEKNVSQRIQKKGLDKIKIRYFN